MATSELKTSPRRRSLQGVHLRAKQLAPPQVAQAIFIGSHTRTRLRRNNVQKRAKMRPKAPKNTRIREPNALRIKTLTDLALRFFKKLRCETVEFDASRTHCVNHHAK